MRAIVLCLTDYPPNGIWEAVRCGLRDVNIYEPLELEIPEGMNVAVEIGSHFGISTMQGELLAHHQHCYQYAVILKALCKRAATPCAKYADEFLQAIDHANGDVRLIITLHDGH